MATILFVDDERAISLAAKRLLAKHGHTVRTATSIGSAQRCTGRYQFDAAFIDVWLGFSSGLDLYDWLCSDQPRLCRKVVFVSGDVMQAGEIGERLRRTGRPVLLKPFSREDLLAALDVALAVRNGPHLSDRTADNHE